MSVQNLQKRHDLLEKDVQSHLVGTIKADCGRGAV